MEPPQQLPQASVLVVEQIKVVDYLLNLEHKQGGPKAKYFRNRGFHPEQWQAMAEALRQHGATQPVTQSSDTRFGRKFTVECQIQTPDGKTPCILTGWIQEGPKPPRSVTAHPNS